MADSIFSGLIEFLESRSGVRDVQLIFGKAASVDELASWEKTQELVLPEEVRQFYLSNDGIKLQWSYQYNDTTMCLGRIKVNSLNEIKPVHLAGGKNGSGLSDNKPSLLDLDRGNTIAGSPWKPWFGGSCKIYTLDYCPTSGHICMVYSSEVEGEREDEGRGIWLLDLALSWHFLCPSLCDFLRLAVVHLGLLQWPYAFTPYGPSPHYQKWLHMFIPKRLELDIAQHQRHAQSLQDYTHTQSLQDHTHSSHAQAGGKQSSVSELSAQPGVNRFDVSRILHSKSLREKRSKVHTNTTAKKPLPPMK